MCILKHNHFNLTYIQNGRVKEGFTCMFASYLCVAKPK